MKLLEKHLLAVELTPVQTVYAKGIYDNHSLPTVVLTVSDLLPSGSCPFKCFKTGKLH